MLFLPLRLTILAFCKFVKSAAPQQANFSITKRLRCADQPLTRALELQQCAYVNFLEGNSGIVVAHLRMATPTFQFLPGARVDYYSQVRANMYYQSTQTL